MTSYVYDFADARPSIATLKAHGAVAVSRYVKRWLPNRYDLTVGERNTYLGNGLGVAYNAEQAAGDMLDQSAAWWTDYGRYVRDRLLSFEVPTDQGITVIASCDTDVTNQLATVVRNYAAFKLGLDGTYGVRAYAEPMVCTALIAEGISPAGSKHWLPGARGWSGMSIEQYAAYPNAGIRQEVGSDIPGTDRNVIVDLVGLGIHWPAGHALAGTGTLIETDWFTMATEADLEHATVAALGSGAMNAAVTKGVTLALQADGGQKAIAEAVWHYLITLSGLGTDSAGSLLANGRLYSGQARDAVNAVAAAVRALPAGGGGTGSVDPAALASALVDELGQPLAAAVAQHLTLTATVQGANA